MNSEIEYLRGKIDKLDEMLVELIIQRLDISEDIIKQKVKNNFSVDDFKRESKIVERLSELNAGKIEESKIERLYQRIFSLSKENFKQNNTNLTPIELLKLKPIIIAGPCVVESRGQIETIARTLSAIGVRFLRGGAFKPRTSHLSFQGLGDDGLDLLLDAACGNQMFTVTEVLDNEQLERNYEKIDVIQIGSRNMSSYGFLRQVGRISAQDSKPVILKRGFAATLDEFLRAADYIRNEGNENVILCLRGVRTFEQIDSKLRFTPDIGAILELKERTELPVIFDPSHSSGISKYVIPLSKAALAAGADGLIIECHNEPEKALIDGHQAIKPEKIKELFDEQTN